MQVRSVKECTSWWCALADAAQALLLIKPCLMACVSKVCVRCDLLCHHMCLHQLLQGLHVLRAQDALVANFWQPGMHLLLFHLGRIEVRHADWRRPDRLQCKLRGVSRAFSHRLCPVDKAAGLAFLPGGTD